MLTLVNLCCNQYPKTLETRPSFHNHPPNTLRSRNSLKKKKKKIYLFGIVLFGKDQNTKRVL